METKNNEGKQEVTKIENVNQDEMLKSFENFISEVLQGSTTSDIFVTNFVNWLNNNTKIKELAENDISQDLLRGVLAKIFAHFCKSTQNKFELVVKNIAVCLPDVPLVQLMYHDTFMFETNFNSTKVKEAIQEAIQKDSIELSSIADLEKLSDKIHEEVTTKFKETFKQVKTKVSSNSNSNNISAKNLTSEALKTYFESFSDSLNAIKNNRKPTLSNPQLRDMYEAVKKEIGKDFDKTLAVLHKSKGTPFISEFMKIALEEKQLREPPRVNTHGIPPAFSRVQAALALNLLFPDVLYTFL